MSFSSVNLLWQHRFRGLMGVSTHNAADDGTALLIRPDEFERRTPGGTLEYDSYDEAERAQGKKARNKMLGNLGIGLALLGLLVTIASPALLSAQRSDDASRARQDAAGYCLAGDAEACEVQAAYGRCVRGDRRACDDAAALEQRWEQSGD